VLLRLGGMRRSFLGKLAVNLGDLFPGGLSLSRVREVFGEILLGFARLLRVVQVGAVDFGYPVQRVARECRAGVLFDQVPVRLDGAVVVFVLGKAPPHFAVQFSDDGEGHGRLAIGGIVEVHELEGSDQLFVVILLPGILGPGIKLGPEPLGVFVGFLGALAARGRTGGRWRQRKESQQTGKQEG
jgi:hypothetical protein